ncbi:MAG: GntR family transcriptional regulator [Deltaproteobacteria bacterium]|nr:GntR family transcriptional regulator [Deltaproteobacteria bacterium]
MFYQLAKKIREDIIARVYGLGELLPSERELCEKYEVSRATARQAFLELTRQGLIMRKQGKGTFVTEAINPHSVIYFLGDTMFLAMGLKKQGIKVNSHILGKRLLDKNKISESISEIISDDIGDRKFLELTRIIYGNNEPWIFDLLYLSEAYWDKDFEKKIICDILAENGTLILDIDVVIEPIIVEKKIADYLQVPEGSAAMLVNRVFTDEKGANSYGKAIIRGDKCKYCFRSKERS